MTIVTAEGMEKKPSAGGTGGHLQPPTFVGDTQQCVTAREGTDVTITIELTPTGGAPTAICWRRGDQELVGERYRVSENNNTVLLNLHHVTRNDVGHYTLTAKNSAGEARRAFQIKVEDAGSDVPVFLRRLSDLAVKVGTRTRFLVEIRSSSEVKVSWHRNEEQLLEGERFHFVHEGNFFCVDVAPVMVEDGGRWTCLAEGAGGRASCSSNLNVLVPKAYKAPEFLEELQALLTEQGSVSLECKVIGVPTPVLRWYKDGKEIKAGDVFALTANPDDPTSLGTYTCEAVNCMGKAYSSSRVHVMGKGSREGSLKPADSMKPMGPPPAFKQELRNEKIRIGDKITLTCQVAVPPWPQSITWYNKEGRVDGSEKYHIMADGLGGYMIEIDHAEAADEGEWKCVATSSEGAKGISTCHVSMTYPKNYRKPRFLESLKAVLTDEGLVSFECKVVGFPTPQLRWFKDGQELKPGDVYQLTGTNSLGSYSCIAKNCMGEATSSAELTVEDIQNQLNEEERLQLFSTNQPPKFIVGLKSCEAKITEDFRFTVQVSVSPEPSILWYRDDEQVEGADRYTVSREALGVCNFDIRCLQIMDQAEWKCVATNDFGHSVTSCFLKLIIPRHFKKPRFLECLRAILSEEGAVNLECKVIGVPQPELKWYKDGDELKPGDIHRIISGQDGTCCLGTYTCEARNCMGTVASSASLLGFEERLMKGAVQQQTEHSAGHVLARNPSLSTIHEERTSQMYDTPATERSATVDERAEVSFSFDGKEVSVSLYETPDLTEEEALQVVEMYADQLSEHVSEHNVVELPPLRFVKESSNTGNLLMEAIVIDVTHDAFSSAEDDLRTDADLEEFSITDDNGQQAPPLPQDVEQDDAAIFEKLNTEFLERALAPTVPYDGAEEQVPPKRPPRKKTEACQGAKPESDTFHSLSPVKEQPKDSDAFHSISPTKGGPAPKEDEDRSEHFTDAVAYISEQDSYASARGSSGEARAFQIVAIEQQKTHEPQSTKSSPAELVRNTEMYTKKKDMESQVVEIGQELSPKQVETKEISSQPESMKKKIRSVESGLGRSFEESTEERIPGEPPGPKPERPARKGSKSRNERSIESGQGGSFEESGDDRTSSETSISAPKLEQKQSQKKMSSSEIGSIESHMKKIQEQQKLSRRDSLPEEGDVLKTAKLEEIKRSNSKEGRVSTEVQTEGSVMRKLHEIHRDTSVEARNVGDNEKAVERTIKELIPSSTNVDLPILQSTAEMKSTRERGESSLIESLTHSLQDIQKGLASVEEQVKLQSGFEIGSAKSSLSVLEALTQPIEDSLALVEEQTALNISCEDNTPDKILQTISQPIQEFHKGLALVEQQVELEMGEEPFLERTNFSILENVAEPVQELQRDIALIQQFAQCRHTDTSEAAVKELPERSIQPALQMITQSLHELQRGIAVLQQHIVYEDFGKTSSHIGSASILETLSHPLHKLRQGLAEVEQEAVLETSEESIGHSIMEIISHPLQELQRGLEMTEHQAAVETETMFVTGLHSQTVLDTLAEPVDEMQRRLAQIGQEFLIEIESAKSLSENISVLKALQTSLHNLQHVIESISRFNNTLEVTSIKTVHDKVRLSIVTLDQPLSELQLCLTDIEIQEFKSKGEDVLITQDTTQSLDKLMLPLSEFKNQLTQIEEMLFSGTTDKLTSQNVSVGTHQSLVRSIRHLKGTTDFLLEISNSETSVGNFTVMECLVQPLQEFTEALVEIEQFAVLGATLKPRTDKKSLSTAKHLVYSIQNLQETIVKIHRENTLQVQIQPGVKTISKLAELAVPLFQVKQVLLEAVQNIILEESETFVSEHATITAVKEVVEALDILKNEVCKTKEFLILAVKKSDPETIEPVETLLNCIQDLEKCIIAVQEQATEAVASCPSLAVFESLLQPLQNLQMAIAVMAPKESSLLILERISESVEELQRGVATIENQVFQDTKQDPAKVSVTKLGELAEPLKELQRELNLVEQKIQFEQEEELTLEVSSLTALSTLTQPLQELQRGLILIQNLAVEQDLKPMAEKAAEVLVEPIMDLQRCISVVQQEAIFQADAVERNGFTILETLAQPLQELQRGLTVVEEQNVMTLEEAPIFEKAASLAALEKVTQSVQELHHRISTIEHSVAVGTTEVTLTELAGVSAFREIAKPLLKFHKGLIEVEDQIFEPGDKPMPDRAGILILEATAEPLQELIRGLAQVEERLVLETGSEIASEKLGASTLEKLSHPLKALQESIALMQCHIVQETETPTVFLTLDQSLQDLQKGLSVIQKHIIMEPIAEKSDVHLLFQTVAHSIEEIHRNIALVEEQAVLEDIEVPHSDINAISILETVVQPLKELQKNLASVQHTVLLENVAEKETVVPMLMSLASPVLELQRGLTRIEENALLEPGGEPTRAVSMLHALVEPMLEIHKGLTEIQEQVVLEPREIPMPVRSDISVLNNLIEPIQQLQETLSVIEQQVALEPCEEPLSKRLGVSVLGTILEPLEQLHTNLGLVEQQMALEAGKRNTSEDTGLSVTETLVYSIQDLERSIGLINYRAATEAKGIEISDESFISMLETLSRPLQELQQGLTLIEDQIEMEAREELLPEKTEISVLKALTQPIEEIQKSIAVIQQQTVYEPIEEHISEDISQSVLKALAQPLHELEQNLVQIEQQALEAEGQPVSEISLSVLNTLAHPVHEIQRGIALVQQQAVLESGVQEMSDQTRISVLQTLAQPLEELEKGIAEIQQQIALEAMEGAISEKTNVSILKVLAKPIQELHRGIALVQECAVYEGGVESFSDKTSASVLETLAQPVQELLKGIAVIQQQALVEHDEVISEKEDVEVLKTLAEPVEELHRALLQVEQQVTLETEVAKVPTESFSVLKTLAKPILELQRSIALIEKQTVLECDEGVVSEKGNIALIMKLAEPLQELQRGIVMIEQQELLEGPLSDDATHISGLPTFVSSTEASPVLGAIRVEEQRALEGDVETLSDRTDLRELESAAFSRYEPRRDVAVVQQQTPLEGRMSELETETTDLQVALVSHEEDRGSAMMREQEVLQESKKHEHEEAECKRKEQERAESLKKEQEEAERKKEYEDAEHKRKEQEEDKRKKEEEEEADQWKKEQEEAESKKKEQGQAERKKKEQEDAERKKKELEEAEHKKKEEEDAELKKKEQEEAERKMKEQEEAERKKKEQEEAERKKKEQEEAEHKKKEQEEADRKNKEQEEAERKKKEQEEAERKNKEQEEAERKRKEEEETEHKKKEKEETERKKKEQEEAERKGEEQKEAERKKKEEEEADRKKKEKEETERKKEEQEEAERKKKEQEEAERKKKEQEEAERKRKEEEETERKKKEKEETERKKKEQEEADRKEKEKEEAERKKKEQEEAERKRKEEEEAYRKKKEKEDTERKKKEQEEAERIKKEQEEAERIKKEQEEAERKKKEQEEAERKKKEEEEAELKKKEQEEAERKNKEQEEAERKRKEEEETERKKKEKEETERKKKEQEEAEGKKKEQEEAERIKKEQEEAERKRKEDEETKRKKNEMEETERKKKEQEEAERKEKEKEEADRKKKEKEETERKKKEQEEAERQKKEKEEAERKRKEEEEADRKKKEKEDTERKKKEQEEAESMKKELEEAERKKKEQEETERIKKEQEEAERKKKEQEEAERKKKEEEEAELKKKEQEEAERIKKEQEEAERKKKKEEEAELKKKEQEEAERKNKEQEEAERKRKEEEETERKKKEKEETERKKKEQEESERIKKEQEEAERKRKEQEETDRKKKEKEETERKKKEQEEAERKKKEQEEAERKKKEQEEADRSKKEQEEAERKKKEQEEADRKKKEEEQADLKKKEQEEAERKKKEQEEAERKRKEEEEAELKKKEREEAERKKKEEEEAELKKKEREEAERKKKEQEEAEHKKKEQEEAERKRKEEEEAELKKKEREEDERKKKEQEESERKKKEQEEADRKKKEKEEAERKRKEEEEADRKKKEKEETERKKKEQEEAERKKKEQEEAECKRKEQEDADRKKIEEEQAELKKKEQEEADRKKKEKEETERKKKEQEEAERKKKEQEEAERKRKEEEVAERKRKEEEEAELKKKQDEEAERKNKEQEEAERKKREQEEADRKKKEQEEVARIKKEQEEAERKKKEEEEDDRKEKEQAETDLKKKEEEEAERKKKEQEEAGRKKKEDEEAERKKKEEGAELKKKEREEDECKKKDEEEVERKRKEHQEAELKKKVQKETERKNKKRKEGERKKIEQEESECKMKEQEEDDADSSTKVENLSCRKRSRTRAVDTGKITDGSAEDSVLKKKEKVKVEGRDPEVHWFAEGTAQRSRSFDERPGTEEDLAGRQLLYDDSLESSETITYSSSSSTLTPTSQRHSRPKTEETRRVIAKERVESGPRDARKKPTFATRLTDRTAAQGSRIKLTCSVVGSPEPVVEWLRNGLPLVGEQRYRTRCEDGLASLEVINASPGDSAEFTCVARNLHGENSSTATLKVFAGFEPAPSPPTFTRPIRDLYRFSDDELILECRVRCHPPPRIAWLKDGVPLQGSRRHQQSELADGVCRLTIGSPDATSDSGQYTCRAENNVWSEQISSTVQFAGRDSCASSRRPRGTPRVSRDARRPHISNVLTDHAVPTGGTLALQVEIKGAPKLDVTWLRGNEPVHFLTPRFRTFEESGVYTLVMTDVTEREAGFYTCRASNSYGHVDTSATVGIVAPGSVRGGKPAMFVNRPAMDMSVAVGEDISVSFRVTGDPKPKVTWMKGLRDITNSQRSLKETLDDYVRLTLKRALVSDAGTYCILAKNVYGCDRAFFTVTIRQRARSLTPGLEWSSQATSNILRDIRDNLEIARMKDVPGPVAGEPVVTDSGRNWLTLSWPKCEVRGGAPVLAYRVEAWPLGRDGGARWIEMGVSPINTFDAFNLKPGAEYKFRVTPRNRYGWGESVITTAPVVVGQKVELPEFTKILPGQQKALQGSNVRLECQVRGDPVPEVKWYRDGMELNDPRFVTHFDGLHSCYLTIDELRDGDSGRYMCEATNKVGRVSTFARLLVINDPKILEADHKLKRGIQDDQEPDTDTPPQFTMRLRDRRVQMTYPVRLTCQVVGRPAPELTWSKDGEALKQDDHHVFWSEENFHTLEMSHTRLEDSGCYSATARNTNGAVSCRCHLVVDKGIRAYVAPEFLFELDPQHSVREGGELRLSAQVEAYPTVGVMWHRDGVRLRPSRRIVMTLNHDGTVELALAGISARDAGVYSCTATNEVGRAETSTRVSVQVTDAPPIAKLPTVIGPEIPYSKVPLFVTKPRSTEAVEGDTVIILCEVVGDPKPEVIWLRDWLKPDYYRDSPHFRRVGDGPQYRLEIPRAKLDFTGAYSVIARNCHGEAKAVISLQIYAKGQGKEDGMDHSSVKHGKVQTLPVIKRELKDLRCCDGDAVALECCVQATPTPDIRWEKGGRLLPLGGDFSAELDGDTARLHIHQVYPEDEGEYTCVAYNELGRALTSACLVVDVPEEKETLLNRQLSRPVGLLSAGSTPRSTPRTTPTRSKSPSIPRQRDREGTPSGCIHEENRPRRLKVAAPKFYAVPHNRIAEEGETVRFQCAIAGHPTPWVTWDKDGLLVTPSARLTLSERDDLRILEISEVTVEDAGFYRITLENEVGRVEASARLEVIGHNNGRSHVVRACSASPRASPTFGRRLIGSAARVGGRLTLACDIRGSPTPSSKWYRNGELVVRSSRVTPTWDGRTARLEIGHLELEDAGMYTCVAENEVGRTRCSARLVVLDEDDPSQDDKLPPVFLQNLLPETVAVDGDMVELQVRLHGTPPLDVIWVKDGMEIPDCEDFRYVDHGDGRFGLRLADVFPQDSGEYRCEAYSEHGDAVTRGIVTVREGSASVQFSKKPTPVLTSAGSTASFCARVHSCSGCSARPQVSWTVAGRPLDPARHKAESDGDVHILHISPVQLCDNGQVTCAARNGMSGDEECVVRTELTVRNEDSRYDDIGSWSLQTEDEAPGMLIRGPSDTTALRGDRVVLKATYVGVPHPLVRWLRAGHELTSGGRVTITAEDGVACLVIENITADDSGKYVVSVENNLGADCHFASVAVEGPADPPAGRPSVSGSGSSVTVVWCSAPYDGGCMVTGYCVEMRRKQDTEWQVVTDRCHSLSYVVPGLTPGEQYVFRVRAENAHGLSEASLESEPFQLCSDEESFLPAFEPRVVTVAPAEEFKANFEVLEELGKGRYGVVHKVQEHATGHKYAAKFIRCIKTKDREKVQEEIDIMNILRHPKLLQLAAAFESPREVVMVMEYISGGELFERVVADDFTLTERDCILFMRQICEGVDYMHQNYVVHLDLKPENIMCHTRTSHQIKLIDFGLAQKINPNIPVRVLFGTPEFIPPEIISYEPIGVESDMWSVGVICYVLLSGLSPFMGDSDAETFANITRADYDFDDEAFDAISQDAKDFISALLIKRKEKRLTARECLHHTWLAQHDEKMSCVRLSTDKLKKFIIRRKWQKTGNAIRALGRMATLSAATRRNSNASSTSGSPRPSLSGCCGTVSRMSSLNEEDLEAAADTNTSSDTNSVINGFSEITLTKSSRMRLCSERSDSGISDCSSITTPSPHSHCQCPTKPLLSKKFSITEEMETCSEKLSELIVHDACKSGRVSSAVGGNTQSRASHMAVGFSDRNDSNNPMSCKSAVGNVPACSSSSAKYNAKKTDSLRQQSSVDSGVHMDVGTCPSPDILTEKVCARKKELVHFQEQPEKDICDTALHKVSGIVQARSTVLTEAQEKETKPKSTSHKKTPLHHPPPISTSNEHSTNYQKAMAFWKR